MVIYAHCLALSIGLLGRSLWDHCSRVLHSHRPGGEWAAGWSAAGGLGGARWAHSRPFLGIW